jgi:hypothetical protein
MKKLVLVMMLAAGSASAHDFWIEPSTFRPAVGDTVTTTLRVGENFVGEAVPRSGQLIDTFVARDARNERDVVGFENVDPAGLLRIDAPGTTVVGLRSKGWTHTLSAMTFARFLREEGCSARIGRAERVNERFTRYAKALLEVSPGEDRILGFRYEIVRESASTFRVLFEDAPMANALVVALDREGKRVEARTGADGRATLKLEKGVWLVKSVHVVRAPAGSGADWESLWASLTFQR